MAQARSRGAVARDDLLRFLAATAGVQNWAHKGLRGALTRLGVAEAVWRPGRNTHSIWEQLNHMVHWKRYIVERLRGRHPRIHQAWPAHGRTLGELRRTLAQLARLHNDLRRAVLNIAPEEFGEAKRGSYPVNLWLVGAAAHESYHIGQILLTRRLYRERSRGR